RKHGLAPGFFARALLVSRADAASSGAFRPSPRTFRWSDRARFGKSQQRLGTVSRLASQTLTFCTLSLGDRFQVTASKSPKPESSSGGKMTITAAGRIGYYRNVLSGPKILLARVNGVSSHHSEEL